MFKKLPMIVRIYFGMGILLIGSANLDYFLGGVIFTPSQEKGWIAKGKQHIQGTNWSHK